MIKKIIYPVKLSDFYKIHFKKSSHCSQVSRKYLERLRTFVKVYVLDTLYVYQISAGYIKISENVK